MDSNKTVYAGWEEAAVKPPVPTPVDKPERSADLNYDDHFAYILGYEDNTFKPNSNITRAESATMIYRLLNANRRDAVFTTTNSFSDVTASKWYNKAVSSMAKGGYVNGYPDGTFGGEKNITRAEFVTLLVNFFGTKDVSCNFNDVKTSHWAYKYIATATSYGWLSGYEDGSFRPDRAITRAEAVAVINRVLERGVNAESQLGNFTNFSDNTNASAWYYFEVIEAANSHEYTGTRPNENWTSNTTAYNYDVDKYERP